MEKQFTPCPACGAIGEIGQKCSFCGTTIVSKEDSVISDARIVRQRTISPQRYAEKISIYHDVRDFGYGLTKVSIGKMYGLVNLNGDIIYPLGSDGIARISKDTIAIGSTEAEGVEPRKYFNLDTGMYADRLGFVEDKENPRKLYRIDVHNGWKPMNTYTNLEGEVHSYDYAELIVYPNIDKFFWSRKIYLLHHGNECSLWILYSLIADENYFENTGIYNGIHWSNSEQQIKAWEKRVETNPAYPICVLEGIQDKYTFEVNNRVVQIVVRTSSGVDVPITLAKEDPRNTTRYLTNDFKQIYNEWCRAIGKQILKTESEECEENNVDSTYTFFTLVGITLVGIIICFAAGIYLLIAYNDFGKIKYLIGGMVSIGCAIWIINKTMELLKFRK